MKKIKFLLPALAALMLFSCDNYLDVNQNENSVPYTALYPKDLLSAAQSNTFRTQAIDMNEFGNVLMNSWAGNVAQVSGGFSKEFQLNIDSSLRNGIWTGLYRNVFNFQNIINYPNPNGKYDYYIAVAKICKAHYMQYLVDLYGDVPYTEAFLGTANVTPKYSDDQFIYRKLIAELESARDLLNNADPAIADDITAYDVMLGGDITKWAQFANTIELRMLLRMSNNTGSVAAYRDSKLATLPQDFVSGYDVKINPGYGNGSDSQQSPFYSANGYDSLGQTADQNYAFICPSGHAYKSLYAYSSYPTGASTEIIAGSGVNYPNVADPRRTRIFRPGAGQGTVIRAVTQGSTVVDVFSTSTTLGLPGRIGIGIYNPYIQVPTTSSTSFYLDYAGNDGYVMTLQESEFLQAEAALRYPTLFTGDQGHFNAGIEASFAFLNVASSATSYENSINTKVKFGWLGSFNDKLHAIMYQKWIGLMGIDGMESFIDYNRTGYPLTPLATSALQVRKPRRLMYPVSEYVANSANVPNITQDQIFAATDPSHPFWMLGDPALGN